MRGDDFARPSSTEKARAALKPGGHKDGRASFLNGQDGFEDGKGMPIQVKRVLGEDGAPVLFDRKELGLPYPSTDFPFINRGQSSDLACCEPTSAGRDECSRSFAHLPPDRCQLFMRSRSGSHTNLLYSQKGIIALHAHGVFLDCGLAGAREMVARSRAAGASPQAAWLAGTVERELGAFSRR